MAVMDKINTDPPGMWTGYAARLPNCDGFSPRMGMLKGIELHVPHAYYQTWQEAIEVARMAAWARYDEWQQAAPEKSMSAHLRDQALATFDAEYAADCRPDA